MASDAIINPVYSLNGLSVSLLALTDATLTRLLSLDICTLEELARIALQTPITVRSELTTLIQHELRAQLRPYTLHCYVYRDGERTELVIESDLFHFVATVVSEGDHKYTCTYQWVDATLDGGVPFHVPQKMKRTRQQRKIATPPIMLQHELPLFDHPSNDRLNSVSIITTRSRERTF